ncbi:hypothetical protein MMC11_005571 [Xylographa trunciseda]|nr:hypothetical protein [Xylographa trunciseda]
MNLEPYRAARFLLQCQSRPSLPIYTSSDRHSNQKKVIATIPSSTAIHLLLIFPAPPVKAAGVRLCVVAGELVLFATAVVVTAGTALVPAGTYEVTNALENEEVGLELIEELVVLGAVVVEEMLRTDDVLVEETGAVIALVEAVDNEEEEKKDSEDEGEATLEILKGAPLSG